MTLEQFGHVLDFVMAIVMLGVWFIYMDTDRPRELGAILGFFIGWVAGRLL